MNCFWTGFLGPCGFCYKLHLMSEMVEFIRVENRWIMTEHSNKNVCHVFDVAKKCFVPFLLIEFKRDSQKSFFSD